MQTLRTRTDRARLDFVAGLMAYNSTGIGRSMTELYREREPGFAGRAPSIAEVGEFMEDSAPYRFGAFFERHNHKMMFDTSLEILDRQKEAARTWLNTVNEPGSVGSLVLDASVSPPTYYKSIDIHTQPGNYHAEFAGFLYHWMIGPFLVYRDEQDQMGWALARGVPNKPYRRILDLGCGIGKSTQPYCDLYPEAEVIGVDYSAAMLKYGHKLAESRGKKIQFRQALAEHTGLEDGSFDLIVAIWLFHELPRKARLEVVREAYRLLRPGGVFAIMESPPFKVLQSEYSPLSAFLLDSTGRRMSDPYIPEFLSCDRVEMLRSGGFDIARDVALPNSLTGWGSGESYFFGAYPWWMSIGEKSA